MDRRFTKKAKVEMRGDGENRYFFGYAAVFYRESEPGTEYRLYEDGLERIKPGAFDRALNDGHDARGLYNHDSNHLLGRVSNDTCRLSVDAIGLRFEIPFNESDPDHQKVQAKIERGDLTGCSFAFSNVSADWEERNADGKTVQIRNITDLDLHDVGPVTYPAYEATEAGFRADCFNENDLVEARSAFDARKQGLKDEKTQSEAEAVELEFRMAEITLDIEN